jgi:site-specific DNA-methyltransferase (adenine-specific)
MQEFVPDWVDAVVCDPPYGLNFMGKGWDHGVPGVEFWAEALRVAKPGAHLLAFGGTRTYHRLTCAIEDAGWEIRDCLMWLYGTGFPKSLDVGKAIDKAAGVEREVIGINPRSAQQTGQKSTVALSGDRNPNLFVTAPATDAACQWDGWGTALKPAWEPIILARKPLSGTVAANVLEYGTGGLNIDGCRIKTTENLNGGTYSGGKRNPAPGDERSSIAAGRYGEDGRLTPEDFVQPSGRWPANLVLDEGAAALLDDQTGERKAGGVVRGTEPSHTGQNGIYGTWGRVENRPFNDTGGASRFFYVAKASRSERERGLESPSGSRANTHPTVKPLALMRWLVRLVTPPGGLALDPFMGSGSTLIAARDEGFNSVGIDSEADYCQLAEARLSCPS